MPPGIEEHALAAISYTGGTTGTPKGVMLSHANLLATARHNLIATGHTTRRSMAARLPHVPRGRDRQRVPRTWVGATQLVLPRFAAGPVVEAIQAHAITHTNLVPTMVRMLLEELDDRPGVALSSLRHIQYAASPISAELQRRLLDRFDCDIAQFTE